MPDIVTEGDSAGPLRRVMISMKENPARVCQGARPRWCSL